MYTLPRTVINEQGMYALVLGTGPPYTVRVYDKRGQFVCTLHNVQFGGRHDPDIATKISQALDEHNNRKEE